MCTTDRERLEWQFVEAISEVMVDLGMLHMLTRSLEYSLKQYISMKFVTHLDKFRFKKFPSDFLQLYLHSLLKNLAFLTN